MLIRNKFLKIVVWGPLVISALLVVQSYFTSDHVILYYWDEGEVVQSNVELTIDEVSNGEKISQDDPRLLKYIRQHHLTPPPHEGLLSRSSYKNPHAKKKQYEQLTVFRYVHKLLNYMSDGFFIECGANDGKDYSNTIPLELDYKWSGILIEPNPGPLKALRELKRNTWVSDVCLSTKPYPFMTTFMAHNTMSQLSQVNVHGDRSSWVKNRKNYKEVEVQCMPLFSILKAMNITQVDYFSLDVESAELAVLKTIPWESLYIKVLSIETKGVFKTSVKAYMTSVGYKYLNFIENSFSIDQIYIHPNATLLKN